MNIANNTIDIKPRLYSEEWSSGDANNGNEPDSRQQTAWVREISIGVRAIFWRGAGSILPEKYGAAPEKWIPELTWLNSLTTSIVENRWRTYIYIYIVVLSSIFFKHALNLTSWNIYQLPKNCSIARKKNILPDSGGWGAVAPQPTPSSYAYRNIRSIT